MQNQARFPIPPSDDTRWKTIQQVMRKHGQSEHALIETLHAVQQSFGCLDRTSLAYVARSLNVPLSKTYGVATFYQFFTLRPPGKHSCVVCTGTACHIKGAPELLRAIRERYGVVLDETTENGELSLTEACCVGTCGLAPYSAIDGQYLGRISREGLLKRLDEALHE